MENRIGFTAGALLLMIAAPLRSQTFADPQMKEGEPVWFQLTEDRDKVGKLLGKPVLVSETGTAFYSWQYQIDSTDEDYSHYAVFRKADGKLISVTRQYAQERDVDAFFPASKTTVASFPDTTKPTFKMRVRRLSEGRLLMAAGTGKTGQLVLIRESELRNFYPWIQAQLVRP